MCHLDLLGRTLTVERGKTDRAARIIALDRSTVELLAAHLAALGLNASTPDAPVFPAATTARPVPYGALIDAFARAAGAVGLPELRPHDLRRLATTVMVRAGVDVRTAQHRLGHSSPATTLRHYAQLVADADREVADVTRRAARGDCSRTFGPSAGSKIGFD